MKKFVFALVLILTILFAGLFTYTKVQAQSGGEIPCPLAGGCDLIENVQKLTGLVRPIAIIALIGVIIYGGFTRLTAAGDPEKEKKSMQILTAGIVGFLIIVFAGVLVGFIGDLLGVENIVDTSPAETPTSP